jgi:hypothetical protein
VQERPKGGDGFKTVPEFGEAVWTDARRVIDRQRGFIRDWIRGSSKVWLEVNRKLLVLDIGLGQGGESREEGHPHRPGSVGMEKRR